MDVKCRDLETNNAITCNLKQQCVKQEKSSYIDNRHISFMNQLIKVTRVTP